VQIKALIIENNFNNNIFFSVLPVWAQKASGNLWWPCRHLTKSVATPLFDFRHSTTHEGDERQNLMDVGAL
jgi:hypothetical protein